MNKNLASLLLLLHCTAVTVSQNCSDGAVEIFGVETDTLIAGRLEICVDGQWFAVYDRGWGGNNARVVCSRKGFGEETTCSDSCFGASQLTQGYQHFKCISGNDPPQRLIDCSSREQVDDYHPHHNAGIICWNGGVLQDIVSLIISQCSSISPPPASIINLLAPHCPASTTPQAAVPERCDCNISRTTTLPAVSSGGPMLSENKFTTSSKNNEIIESESGNIALKNKNWLITAIAALGVVSAILLLSLVGVVLGWAWSCYRRRLVYKSPSFTPTSLPLTDKEMESNPCYAQVTPTLPDTSTSPCGMGYYEEDAEETYTAMGPPPS